MPKPITMGWILINPKDLNVLQVHPTATGLYRMRREMADATIFESCASAIDFQKNFAGLSPNLKSCRVFVEFPD